MTPIVREAWVGGKEQELDKNNVLSFLEELYYAGRWRAGTFQAWLGLRMGPKPTSRTEIVTT